jgi:hypothetical protein
MLIKYFNKFIKQNQYKKHNEKETNKQTTHKRTKTQTKNIKTTLQQNIINRQKTI